MPMILAGFCVRAALDLVCDGEVDTHHVSGRGTDTGSRILVPE